jgi:hypothetical protein
MATRSVRIGAAIVGLLMIGSTVAGCGGSSDAYCGDLKKASASFGALNSADYAKLDEALTTFHSLAEEAPSKVEDDWKTLDGAITTMQKALQAVGLKFSDLGDLQAGKIPAGLDQAKMTQLSAALGKVDATKLVSASKNISKHAKDECNVTLGS